MGNKDNRRRNKKKKLRAACMEFARSFKRKRTCSPGTAEDVITEDRASRKAQQSDSGEPSNPVEEVAVATVPLAQALHEDEVLAPIKTEPQDEDFTIVIQDPLTQTMISGTYRELFESVVDDQEEPEEGRLVIDVPPPPPPPPPKQPKPKKVYDLNYYKTELEKCKKELRDTKKELELKKRELITKTTTVNDLRRQLNNCKQKFKKERLKLMQKLSTAEDELEIVRLRLQSEAEATSEQNGGGDSDVNRESAQSANQTVIDDSEY